jgi:very-short-patch-repair endonuclease
VAEVERRLLDPATAEQALGVVTFNQKQQTLILGLLDAARRRNSELDRFFSEDRIEFVFVKNLESVQGDERDVILFSTTFGTEQTDRVSMNFGPLNKSGGERRLNVAITRARAELKVFSSLRADLIGLSRTAALGVRDLKHFLEFANKGVRALSEAVFGSQGDFDSPLEATVARDLREKGWILHPQVGVSQFRIDLSVVDPRAPGRYLAGIECDGATYHCSATARDRDLVRESVLRGLGWEILRLWSTDYWIALVGVISKLDARLQVRKAARGLRV